MELSAIQQQHREGGAVHSQREISVHNEAGQEHDDQFVRSFTTWLRRFGEDKQRLLSRTFLDEQGTRRHLDSWTEFDDFSHVKSQASTGCVNISVDLPAETGSKPTTVVVNFLTNFRTLWGYYNKDGTDEVSKYAPLFKLYVHLYFHRRTVQLVIALGAYYIACLVIIDIVYPIWTPILRFINYFSVFLQVCVYLAMVVLFRGTIFPPDGEAHAANEGSSTKDHPDRDLSRRLQSMSCLYYLKEALFKSTAAARGLVNTTRDGSKQGRHDSAATVPFYDAVNIALKFLSKHGRSAGVKLNLTSRWHTFKLLFLFFLLPLSLILSTYATPASPYDYLVLVCKEAGHNSVYCNNFKYVFICTLGYSLPLLLKMIFSSSVLLALVALSIGADVGRALVDLWVSRFGCLRILDAEGNEIIGRSGPSAPGRGGHLSGQEEAIVNALHSAEAGERPKPAATAKANHSKAIPSATCAAGKARSAIQAAMAGDAPSVTPSEALILVQRDAYESYLFLREYMSTASKVWSFTILNFIFLAVFFCTLFLLGAVANGKRASALLWAYYSIYTAVRVFLLTMYPITALAHANSYVYALQEQFLVSAPEDFAILGGRDCWLEFLEKVPAMWTVYGLAVSWDRLSGLLWTGVAGLGAIAMSSLFTNQR